MSEQLKKETGLSQPAGSEGPKKSAAKKSFFRSRSGEKKKSDVYKRQPYVLSLWLPLSLGQFTFIVNMFFILAQIPLLRKEYQPVQLLQIGVNVVFSLFIDVSMSLLEGFTPSNPLISLLAVVAGCATLGLGISIEVAADMLLVPGEGVVKAINRRVGGRFGTVKVMFDLSCVIIAALVSVCSMGGIREMCIRDRLYTPPIER